METQISQVAQQQASSSIPSGAYSRHSKPNPKGQMNTITAKSHNQVEDSSEKSEEVK